MRIAGCGCALIDYLYNGVDFESAPFQALRSIRDGDGGIDPGKLVFASELEAYSGLSLEHILEQLVGGRVPDAVNLGGPAVVALINLAQLLGEGDQVAFYGFRGDDDTGRTASEIVSRTPVEASAYLERPGLSPATWVLSDPDYDGGNGERSFINAIGEAGSFTPRDLGSDFYRSDIVLLGGTALTPGIHDELSTVLGEAKRNGAITAVNTVYDFRNQQRNPDGRWPMGDGDRSYPLIDLLLCDAEEALRLSGAAGLSTAARFFLEMGVGTAVITNGAKPFICASSGRLFEKTESLVSFPVSAKIAEEIAAGGLEGDTTGCGDNFVGGFVYSLAEQLKKGSPGSLDLSEAAAWAASSGGYACRYMGGTMIEGEWGEKRNRLLPYVEAYQEGVK